MTIETIDYKSLADIKESDRDIELAVIHANSVIIKGAIPDFCRFAKSINLLLKNAKRIFETVEYSPKHHDETFTHYFGDMTESQIHDHISKIPYQDQPTDKYFSQAVSDFLSELPELRSIIPDYVSYLFVGYRARHIVLTMEWVKLIEKNLSKYFMAKLEFKRFQKIDDTRSRQRLIILLSGWVSVLCDDLMEQSVLIEGCIVLINVAKKRINLISDALIDVNGDKPNQYLEAVKFYTDSEKFDYTEKICMESLIPNPPLGSDKDRENDLLLELLHFISIQSLVSMSNKKIELDYLNRQESG